MSKLAIKCSRHVNFKCKVDSSVPADAHLSSADVENNLTMALK